jgi:hypothetical protein
MGLGIKPIYDAIPVRYALSASLTNEAGETIGKVDWTLEGDASYDFKYSSAYVTFQGVNPNKISGNLVLTITGINGISPKTAGERGYISIVTGNPPPSNLKFDFDLPFVEAKLVKYRGSGQVVIPKTILGRPVTYIRKETFENSNLTSVTISNGVTSIGKECLDYNYAPMNVRTRAGTA